MSFDQELQKILNGMEGVLAAGLMGLDGILVTEVRKDPSFGQSTEVSVEFSRILKDSLKIVQANDLGHLQEIVISTDRYRLVLYLVNHEYFLVLMLQPEAYVGKGKFLVKKALPELISSFEA